MTSHLRHYQNPEVQRRIMAVLWMVPIYGFTSWLSLVFPKKEQYFGIVRDAYEAYAVYTFIGLLIAVLAEGKGLPHVVERIKHHVITEREAVIEAKKVGLRNLPKEHIKPPFPCCYRNNQPREVASAWLYQCQMMAMQFVYSKPLLTVIPLLLKVTGAYRNDIPAYSDNTIHWDSMQLYIMLAQNVSVFIAFYGLLSFYHGTEKDLEWCDPWPKFLCIKGVVFATFWQSVGIQFMSSMGLVDERTAVQIQNLLICIEMLLASLAHFYIFPYQEWQIGYQKQRETGIRLRDTLAISDFVKDMGHMVTRWDHHQDPNASTELLIRLDEKGDVELGEVKVDDHLFNRDIVHSIDSEMNGDGGLIRENDGKHLIESSPLLGAAAPSYSSMVPILSTELNESSFSNNRIGSVSNDDLKYSKSENEFLINVLPDGGSEAYVGQNFMPAAVFDSAEQPDQGELMVHSVSSDEGEHTIQENSDSSDQYQSTGTQDTPTEWFEVYQSPRKEDSFFSRGESKNSTIEETTTNSGISLINNNSSHGLHLESLSSIAEVASESTPKEASLNCSEVEEVDTASSVPKQPRGGKDNLHEDDEVADV